MLSGITMFRESDKGSVLLAVIATGIHADVAPVSGGGAAVPSANILVVAGISSGRLAGPLATCILAGLNHEAIAS